MLFLPAPQITFLLPCREPANRTQLPWKGELFRRLLILNIQQPNINQVFKIGIHTMDKEGNSPEYASKNDLITFFYT